MTSIKSQSEHVDAPGMGNHLDYVERASKALRAGQVVVIPTDTVYGLAAALNRPEAISHLYAIKNRPLEKAIPVLLSDASEVHQVAADLPASAAFLASCFWPGALTLVLPALLHLPPLVTSTCENGRRTVAVRVPDDPLARAIIAASGGALAVTSANHSGQRPALDAAEAAALAMSPPLLVVDGGRVPGGIPSTVVLATGDEPEILRKGAISPTAIMEALRNHDVVAGAGASKRYDQPMTEHDPHRPPAKTST
jgi:L-threonylcarbamoyladenylate synthase